MTQASTQAQAQERTIRKCQAEVAAALHQMATGAERYRIALRHLKRVSAPVLPEPEGEPEFDPSAAANKLPNGRLTLRGVETCYRLFDAGKTPYAVAELMQITPAGAAGRYKMWKAAGGADKRPKASLK